MSLREPGLWVARDDTQDLRGKTALFLDRDGTVIADEHYLSDPAGVALVAPTIALMQSVSRAGHPLIVVTNQSGIARGLFTWRDVEAVTSRMLHLLQAADCPPAAIIACGYYTSHDPRLNFPSHPMRKPNPGMLQLAAKEWGVLLAGSVIVGDRESDMLAGAAAGLKTGVMVGEEDCAGLPEDFTVLCPGRTHAWPDATRAVIAALRRQ
jgi:D-glycero-D-manno-heptose 1,7-bisphosphate phosphatase